MLPVQRAELLLPVAPGDSWVQVWLRGEHPHCTFRVPLMAGISAHTFTEHVKLLQ